MDRKPANDNYNGGDVLTKFNADLWTGIFFSIFLSMILTLLVLTVAFAEQRGGNIGQIDWPICGNGKRVTCIVDGDTLWYKREKFRLLGFDTPEKGSHARCGREKELAKKATDRLAQLLSSGSVRYEYHKKDRYGRSLAAFFVNGQPVSEIMIGEGTAIPYSPAAHKAGAWCN